MGFEELVDRFLNLRPAMKVRRISLKTVSQGKIAITTVIWTASRPIQDPKVRTNNAFRRLVKEPNAHKPHSPNCMALRTLPLNSLSYASLLT